MCPLFEWGRTLFAAQQVSLLYLEVLDLFLSVLNLSESRRLSVLNYLFPDSPEIKVYVLEDSQDV